MLIQKLKKIKIGREKDGSFFSKSVRWFTIHVEVCTEDLVSVSLHPTKDGDVALRLYVPQPDRLIDRFY